MNEEGPEKGSVDAVDLNGEERRKERDMADSVRKKD